MPAMNIAPPGLRVLTEGFINLTSRAASGGGKYV
jgi:hypothetical protein